EGRSPSFHVRPQVGFYHCFGCGEGGDVFTFLQKMDHVSFSEAVGRMAGCIGYELHYEDGGAATDHGNRARILAANQAAADFYVAQLTTADAEPGRKFLGERGFDASAAERFGIGFAPRGQALGKHLTSKGFTEDELVIAGLLGRGERGDVYNRFRGRLVWPIRDVTGSTLGFGARKLLDDDNGPKYLNTPETPVYHKSQVLYGLDLAKRDIARGKQVVVVEGYTDVMACHLAGVTTAVATCGTSFGVDHIRIVRRIIGDTDNPDTTGTGEVIFTFDPDEAGQKAASRAFAEEQRFAAQTFVAVAPEGLDPCDLRLNRGDDAVRRLIKTRKPMFEFMVRRVLTGFDLETVEGRVSALRAAAPVVAGIRDQSMSVGYVRNLAGWLGLDPTEVQRAVTAAHSAQSAQSAQGDQSRGDQGHGAQVHSGQQRGSRDDARQAEPILILDEPSITRLATDTTTRTERDVLMAILQHPQLVGSALMSKAATVGFGDASLEIVRDAVAVSLAHADSPDWIARVTAEVPQRYATLVNQLAVAPIPAREDTLPVYCVSIVSDFIDRNLLREKRQVMGSLQRLDATTEPERYAEVQRELVRIETERRVLRNE
ncbi:MAG: DNA primase, partial [Salinibacterium sp.]|nr:DNA primase [Salinibacterium sp.]